MSRKKSIINTVYQPIGTICLSSELVERLKAQAELSGGVAAVVRACLMAVLMPDSPDSQPFVVSVVPKAPTTKASEEEDKNAMISQASDW